MTNLFLKGNLQRKKNYFFLFEKFANFLISISKMEPKYVVLLFNLLIQANYLGKFR